MLSALGLLYADIETSASAAMLRRIDQADPTAVAAAFAMLEARTAAELGRAPGEVAFTHEADFRYKGQAFELPLAFAEGLDLTPEAVDEVRALFDATHERAYGYRLPDTAVEIVTLRVTARVEKGAGRLPEYRRAAPRPESRRPVYFGPDWGRIDTAILDRAALALGARQGPAVIEEYEGTTIVPPDCHAALDAAGNIIVTLPAAVRAVREPIHEAAQ